MMFWESIRNSDNPEEFKSYIAQYPGGEFVAIARARFARLQEQALARAMPSPTAEPALLGPWKFGRSRGDGLFFPVGHLCDVTLSSSRGAHGNVIAACDSNESFWRVRGDQVEFVNREGHVTTVFTRKSENFWEGPYLGSSPGSAARGIIHYLRR
jgi:hypothetical protein